MVRSQEKASQVMLQKQNTEYLKDFIDWTHSVPGIENSSVLNGRIQILRNWNLNFFKALAPNPQSDLAKSAPR